MQNRDTKKDNKKKKKQETIGSLQTCACVITFFMVIHGLHHFARLNHVTK